MTSLFSDAALAEYARWVGGYGPPGWSPANPYIDFGAGHLKYAYDASRAGSKLQSVPLRPAGEWILGQEPVNPFLMLLLGLALGYVAKDIFEIKVGRHRSVIGR